MTVTSARGAGRRGALALALAAVLVTALSGCTREPTKYREVRARNGEILVAVADIASGDGRFLTYRASGGRRVDFFVYRDGAGEPHAVLDACRTCYRWRKGYLFHRGEVVCIKCDMVFKIDELAQGTGSCVPIQVKTLLRGEDLVIPASELEAGARFF